MGDAIESAKVVTVIEVISRTGDGTPDNPVRTIRQYWAKNGRLIYTEPITCVEQYQEHDPQ